MPPRVSVVMPVYNAERTLSKAIESILNQSFPNFELLMVDDGAKDSSWDIMARYAVQDERVRPLRHAVNQGNTAARNTGSNAAGGDYIAVQDADDVSLPERLEREVAYLDMHLEAGAVASPAQRIDGQDRVIGFWQVPATPELVRANLLLTNPLPHTTVMMRRSLFQQVGGYQTTNAPDYDLLWRISQVSEIHTLREPLALYRSDETDQNRITVGQASKQVKGAQEISVRVAKALMNGKPLDEEAYSRFFMSVKGYGSLQAGDMKRLQSLWDVLAADPIYRQVIGAKLLSCSLRNVRSAPSEALALVRVARRQFNVPVKQLAKRYGRALVLDRLRRQAAE